MDNKRKKFIHTQGLVAKVQWIPVANEEGYTGIYKYGSDASILRLSQTANVSKETKGLTPSLALKFLIDGRPSDNIVAMHDFNPNEGSWNFFEK